MRLMCSCYEHMSSDARGRRIRAREAHGQPKHLECYETPALRCSAGSGSTGAIWKLSASVMFLLEAFDEGLKVLVAQSNSRTLESLNLGKESRRLPGGLAASEGPASNCRP